MTDESLIKNFLLYIEIISLDARSPVEREALERQINEGWGDKFRYEPGLAFRSARLVTYNGNDENYQKLRTRLAEVLREDTRAFPGLRVRIFSTQTSGQLESVTYRAGESS